MFFTPALISASRALPSKLPKPSFSPSNPRFSSSALISPAKAFASRRRPQAPATPSARTVRAATL